MLTLHRRACASTEDADRYNANRKEDETHQRKLPIHQEKHDHGADDGNGLFEHVAAHTRQRLLHVARVVGDARHEKAALHPIKEIHRVANYLGKELIANIIHHLVAHPVHVINVAVGAETPDRHHQRNGETNPNDRIDLWADVQYFVMREHRFRIWRRAVENKIRNLEHRQRQQRVHQTVGDAKCEPDRKAPFVGTGVAVEPPIRLPCRPHGFPEREFYFGAFCLAHNRGDVAGADNSVSIASITACVEIWFIGNRGCLGTNSVKGDVDVPCKINAGLSRGRQ